MSADPSNAMRRQTRLAAIVIATAGIVWLGGLALGRELGLPTRFAFLLDLACIAAFTFALIVLMRVWLQRRGEG